MHFYNTSKNNTTFSNKLLAIDYLKPNILNNVSLSTLINRLYSYPPVIKYELINF